MYVRENREAEGLFADPNLTLTLKPRQQRERQDWCASRVGRGERTHARTHAMVH